MWASLSDDLLNHMATLGSIQALPCMLLLEKRCQRLERLNDRLRACRRLMDEPLKLRVADILGYTTSQTYFVHYHIGDSEMKFLAEALVSGALPAVTVVELRNNNFGDAGMTAFASAVGSGALAQCQHLSLHINLIGDVGMTAFAQAIKPVSEGGSGALPAMTVLDLRGNNVGDAGMTAFASAVGSGALPVVTRLYLSHNNFGDAGMTAFALAFGGGGLASLDELHVDWGPLGTEHPALKAACEARGIRD